jgi:hypothetical protein
LPGWAWWLLFWVWLVGPPEAVSDGLVGFFCCGRVPVRIPALYVGQTGLPWWGDPTACKRVRCRGAAGGPWCMASLMALRVVRACPCRSGLRRDRKSLCRCASVCVRCVGVCRSVWGLGVGGCQAAVVARWGCVVPVAMSGFQGCAVVTMACSQRSRVAAHAMRACRSVSGLSLRLVSRR